MKDLTETLPGIEQIRTRFLSLLEERQTLIAHHTVAAWDSENLDERRYHMEMAQRTLHQVAGTAGSIGFDELGQTASVCENEIVSWLKGPESDTFPLLSDIIFQIDEFVTMSQTLLTIEA